jgi:hypothetical protein
MPSYARLDNCRSGKNVGRLLALLLALTIPAPLLLAGDDGRNNDRGRLVDPIVGSWIIHIHVRRSLPLALYHPTSRISPLSGKMVSPQVQIQIPTKQPLMACGESWDL